MLKNGVLFARNKLDSIHYDVMKHEQVIVDYTVMLNSSITCLMVAISGWVLIR